MPPLPSSDSLNYFNLLAQNPIALQSTCLTLVLIKISIWNTAQGMLLYTRGSFPWLKPSPQLAQNFQHRSAHAISTLSYHLIVCSFHNTISKPAFIPGSKRRSWFWFFPGVLSVIDSFNKYSRATTWQAVMKDSDAHSICSLGLRDTKN